jgi:hypothetical protein
MMNNLRYLSALLIVSTIMGALYVGVQQSYRSDANDPQTQIAGDLRSGIERGKPWEAGVDSVDLESSLAVFRQAYDSAGRPIASTGFINGKAPSLPRGVIDFVRAHGEESVTWQPSAQARLATVVVRVNGGPIRFIAVGRSLREVESRVSSLIRFLLLCWVFCIVIVLINWLAGYRYQRRTAMV